MKTFIFYLLGLAFMFSSCNDNVENPSSENEEELITTITLVFTESGTTKSFQASYSDPDGDGGKAPVIDSIILKSNTSYNVVIRLSDESKEPYLDLAEEIIEEAADHQLFFTDGRLSIAGAINYANQTSSQKPVLDLKVEYLDQDKNGKNLGLNTKFITGKESSGKLVVSLKHQPGLKENTNSDFGDPSLGETDAEVEFNVTIE